MSNSESNGSSNVAAVAIVALVLLALVAGYFLFLRSDSGAPSIDVPEEVDINVNTDGG